MRAIGVDRYQRAVGAIGMGDDAAALVGVIVSAICRRIARSIYRSQRRAQAARAMDIAGIDGAAR